jgi:hypothetical protein
VSDAGSDRRVENPQAVEAVIARCERGRIELCIGVENKPNIKSGANAEPVSRFGRVSKCKKWPCHIASLAAVSIRFAALVELNA